MVVWVLLLVLLEPVNGFEPTQFLNKFDTFEECNSERDRVGFEMAESYPADLSFRIVCRDFETDRSKPDV